MAAKRIAQSAVDWAALSERVPPHQRAQFIAFKAKSEGYLRRVLANPEKAPEINWAFYKKNVPLPQMVDEFQKQYQALTIPYPQNPKVQELDELEKTIKSDIATFKSGSETRIAEYKKELAHLASLLPYDQMTMEDFRDSYPELALDPINKPTFWPHEPEDQLDYVEKDPQPAAH